jgi:hypothetical protein
VPIEESESIAQAWRNVIRPKLKEVEEGKTGNLVVELGADI